MKSSNKGLVCAAALSLSWLCASSAAQESGRTVEAAPSAPLPAGPAPWEVGLPLPVADAPFAPPAGAILTPAEYARNEGLLLRWTGGFEDELVALTVPITTLDPTAIVTIVVSGGSQQASAIAALSSGGADLSQVQFLTAASNSVWMRDYGPRFILEDNELAIVDHVYNRPARPQDNAIPVVFASNWSLNRYDIPLVHGGGNFHLFQDGDAFMTELILDENPSLSELQIQTYYDQYQNLNVTIFPGFPDTFDSTRHIDMWMLPVRDKVVIIGEYLPSSGLPFTITEDAVDDLEARGYSVLRTPGWNDGFDHYTYTNAVVFNRLVLVPQYSAYAASNAQAMSIYQQAFPGKTILGINADNIVQYAGVFHCIVMHVPDARWIFEDDFETGDGSVWSFVATP